MKQNPLIKQMMDTVGFDVLSQVQAKVIPAILKNQSLVVTSPTGTGKTHAYLFGIFAKLTKRPVTQAVIVAPTRELAHQISRFAQELADAADGIQIKTYVGGEKRITKKSDTQAQLVIGTIGRLNDLYLEANTIDLHTASMIVLDEADMLVDQGFIEACDRLLSKLSSTIQTLVFSATIPAELQPFLRKYLTNSKLIQVVEDAAFNPQIEYQLIAAKHRTYIDMCLHILQGLQPNQCLIFANSKSEVSELGEKMREQGHKVIELHKNLTSAARKHALMRIDQGKVPYIVASDIAARGLDIENISHVISLGFPKDLSYFKHRAGRTGRAGKTGVCLTIYKDNDQNSIVTLIKEGIDFKHVSFQDGNWKELMPYQHKHRYLNKEDKKIVSMIKGRKQKVKPNYKKKQQEEIEKFHAKKRRAMIAAKIKEQKKARAKERSKGGSS